MRSKVVPEPRSVDFLREVQAALPLVPGNVADCCDRIRDRTDLQSRDGARAFVTFARALGLAAEAERGFRRTREDPSDEVLAQRFREHVFGVREVLAALDGETRTADDVFEGLRDEVPRWERERTTDWEAEWRERTRRLLAWADEFGLVERAGAGYRATDRTGPS